MSVRVGHQSIIFVYPRAISSRCIYSTPILGTIPPSQSNLHRKNLPLLCLHLEAEKTPCDFPSPTAPPALIDNVLVERSSRPSSPTFPTASTSTQPSQLSVHPLDRSGRQLQTMSPLHRSMSRGITPMKLPPPKKCPPHEPSGSANLPSWSSRGRGCIAPGLPRAERLGTGGKVVRCERGTREALGQRRCNRRSSR